MKMVRIDFKEGEYFFDSDQVDSIRMDRITNTATLTFQNGRVVEVSILNYHSLLELLNRAYDLEPMSPENPRSKES